MRKLMLSLLMLLSLSAGELGWTNDYEAARKEAAATGKVIYVLVTTPVCRWCKKLKTTTLADPEVRGRLERLAVGVEATRSIDNYPSKLKAPMVPMSFFLSPNDRVLVKMPGYWGKEDFMSILDDVERKVKEE